MNLLSQLAASPAFTQEQIAEVLPRIERVLRSGKLILGEETERFEAELAARVGVTYAVAVSSCTAALELALRAFGIRDNVFPVDEVIVSTNTFAATARAVLNAGADVVPVDMNARDFSIDSYAVTTALTPKTRAITVTHVAGVVGEGFVELREECRIRRIPLIEDCAHAHGARALDIEAGALGTVGCFSFYPTKVLTSGVGGALTTNSLTVAEYARRARHHGFNVGGSVEVWGNDWLMSEVTAVLASVQLAGLDAALRRRRAVAAAYDAALGNTAQSLFVRSFVQPAWYKYPVILPRGVNRDVVRDRLRARGIATGALYDPPLHRLPMRGDLNLAAASKDGEAAATQFPNADDVLPRHLCLPMHARVEVSDCAEIVAELRRAMDGA